MSARIPAAVLAAALLTGCQTTSIPTYTPIVSTLIDQFAPETAKQFVKNKCDWVESNSTLEAIAKGIIRQFDTYNIVDVYEQIAAEICAAVQPRVVAGRRMAPVKVVRGIRLHGSFVR